MESKRCAKCILPETYGEVDKFDKEGVCDVCRMVENQKNIVWEKKEQELKKLLNKHKELAKKEGRKYNIIVPSSGGKDSAYTLYTMIKKFGMTPLVVTYNHLFFRDVIKRNQEKVLKKLGADCIEFKPNWKIVKKLMLKSLKKTGDFCWHCHTGIYSFPMQIAVKYRIPLLVWGSTDYTLETAPRDWKFFKRVFTLGLDYKEFVDDEISLDDLQPFMYPPEHQLKELNIQGILHGNYMKWDVRKQLKIIKKELDWEEAKVEGTPYTHDKIECKYIGIRDYLKFIKRGYGRTAQLTSVDIRAGLMDRETALQLSEKYDGTRPDSLTEFLEDVGISEKKFMEIAKGHKRTYKDRKKP